MMRSKDDGVAGGGWWASLRWSGGKLAFPWQILKCQPLSGVFQGSFCFSWEGVSSAPQGRGVLGWRPPASGRSRGLGRRALFPWLHPHVSILFSPSVSVPHIPTWSLKSPFFCKSRGGTPASRTLICGGNSQLHFPSRWKNLEAGALTSPQYLLSVRLASAPVALLDHMFSSIPSLSPQIELTSFMYYCFLSFLCPYGFILFFFSCCHLSMVSGKKEDKHMCSIHCVLSWGLNKYKLSLSFILVVYVLK